VLHGIWLEEDLGNPYFTSLDVIVSLIARLGFDPTPVELYASRSGWEVRGLVDPQNPYSAGAPVWARGASKAEGFLTGTQRVCRLEGCTGASLSVRWPKEGQRDCFTYPCCKAMEFRPDGWHLV
jgi:hypothetical protein